MILFDGSCLYIPTLTALCLPVDQSLCRDAILAGLALDRYRGQAA